MWRNQADVGPSVRCESGEVHVWRIDLDSPAISLGTMKASLSHKERERADSFRSKQAHDRWVASRAALRHILSTYTGSTPLSLVFRTGPYGKPFLSSPAINIPFSLSHTGGLALLAISSESSLGVDVEYVHQIDELEEMSRHFFALSETGEIMALAPQNRLSAFFACWTRKEAFVKALGKGLRVRLDQFRVTVRPEEPPRLVSCDWPEPLKWSLTDLSESNVAAALAIRAATANIRRFDFPMTYD